MVTEHELATTDMLSSYESTGFSTDFTTETMFSTVETISTDTEDQFTTNDTSFDSSSYFSTMDTTMFTDQYTTGYNNTTLVDETSLTGDIQTSPGVTQSTLVSSEASTGADTSSFASQAFSSSQDSPSSAPTFTADGTSDSSTNSASTYIDDAMETSTVSIVTDELFTMTTGAETKQTSDAMTTDFYDMDQSSFSSFAPTSEEQTSVGFSSTEADTSEGGLSGKTSLPGFYSTIDKESMSTEVFESSVTKPSTEESFPTTVQMSTAGMDMTTNVPPKTSTVKDVDATSARMSTELAGSSHMIQPTTDHVTSDMYTPQTSIMTEDRETTSPTFTTSQLESDETSAARQQTERLGQTSDMVTSSSTLVTQTPSQGARQTSTNGVDVEGTTSAEVDRTSASTFVITSVDTSGKSADVTSSPGVTTDGVSTIISTPEGELTSQLETESSITAHTSSSPGGGTSQTNFQTSTQSSDSGQQTTFITERVTEPTTLSPITVTTNQTTSSVTIHCKNAISWYFDGQPITGSDRMTINGDRLTISPVYPRDRGVISCESKYRNGMDKLPEMILPTPPVVYMMPTMVAARAEQKVNFTCCSSSADDLVWSEHVNVFQRSANCSTVYFIAANDSSITCQARSSDGLQSAVSARVSVIPESEALCDNSLDEHQLQWYQTRKDSISYQPCPYPMQGSVSRLCSDVAQWSETNFEMCVGPKFFKLYLKVLQLSEGIGDREITRNLSAELRQMTDEPLKPGNLNVSVEMLSLLSKLSNTDTTSSEVDETVNTISQLTSPQNDHAWKTLLRTNSDRAVQVLAAMDSYVDNILQAPHNQSVQAHNIDLTVITMSQNTTSMSTQIQFPAEDDMDDDGDRLTLVTSSSANASRMTPLSLAVVRYAWIHELLPATTTEPGSWKLGSRILSATADKPQLEHKPELMLEFDHMEEFDPADWLARCVYWNYSVSMWDTWGCYVNRTEKMKTSCHCEHMTNFAVLVTPKAVLQGSHGEILSIVTLVGCIVSITCLVITVLFHIAKWKVLRSHHAVVLVNLCIALILANAFFLIMIERTSPEDMCTGSAMVLHFLFLAAFTLMFVEAVQLLFYVVFVFHVRRKRETMSLLIAAWVIPAAVVAVTAVIRKLEGYGTEYHCWLDTSSNVIWAFLAPVILIVVVNICVGIAVLRRVAVSRLHRMQTDDRCWSGEVRAVLWNLLVVTPVLGVTWIPGLLSINNGVVALQYVFAVANGLQGILIFVFHAACNRKRLGASSSGSGSTQRGKYKPQWSVNTQRTRLKSNGSKKSDSSKNSKSSSLGTGQDSRPSDHDIYDTIPEEHFKNGRLSFTAAESPSVDSAGTNVAFEDETKGSGSMEAGSMEPASNPLYTSQFSVNGSMRPEEFVDVRLLKGSVRSTIQ